MEQRCKICVIILFPISTLVRAPSDPGSDTNQSEKPETGERHGAENGIHQVIAFLPSLNYPSTSHFPCSQSLDTINHTHTHTHTSKKSFMGTKHSCDLSVCDIDLPQLATHTHKHTNSYRLIGGGWWQWQRGRMQLWLTTSSQIVWHLSVCLCQINYSSALMLHAHAASQAPPFSRVQTQTSLSSFSFSSSCARMHYNN